MNKESIFDELCAIHKALYFNYFQSSRIARNMGFEPLDQMQALERKWQRLMELQKLTASREKAVDPINNARKRESV